VGGTARRTAAATAIGLAILAPSGACKDDAPSIPEVVGGTILASGAGISGIATDGTNVYYGLYENVVRVPGTGGTPHALTSFLRGTGEDEIIYIAAGRPDANGKVPLAWSAFFGGLSITNDSSVPPRMIGRPVVENIATTDDGWFTWCERHSDPSRDDAGVDDAGRPVRPEYFGGRGFRARADGEPISVPGCAAPGFDLSGVIASLPSPPRGIYIPIAAADQTTVYFSTVVYGSNELRPCEGHVYAVEKATGAMRTLADTGCGLVGHVAVDDRDVYVVNDVGEDPRFESRIFRVPKAGGTPELFEETKPYRVSALAVDANALYWTGDFSRKGISPGEIRVVVRVPKR
jgi:hypothetical protein